MIARSTPTNLSAELSRLEAEFHRGSEQEPRFEYAPAPKTELEDALANAASMLRREPDPLAPLYAARAEELGLELAMCRSVGSRAFHELARRRFAEEPTRLREADALVEGWLHEAQPGPDELLHDDTQDADLILTDDATETRSLRSRLSAEIGARRIPFRVVVTDRLSSLAATGDGVILVAAGRLVSTSDVERTVLHELEGHVLPRVRAVALPLRLFRLGTARGTDDQEGRAILLEERAGHLRPKRRRELALRHRACQTVEASATFVETTRALRERGAPLELALGIAARAHRGGGLARERVYLPAYLQTKSRLAEEPAIERVLAAGRISLAAAPLLEHWLEPRETS